MADKEPTKAKQELASIVLKGHEPKEMPEGVRAVDFETYREISVAGGYGDPATDVSQQHPALDLVGLRANAADTKTSKERRDDASSRLAEIEKILSKAKE